MFHRLFALSLALSAIVCGADLPSGDEVLRRCIERSGGAEALAAVKALEMTGTVEMVGHNLSGAIIVDQQDDKEYSAIEFPGIGKIEEGYDGSVAWESSVIQGTRIKEGDEKAAVQRSSSFRVLSKWKEFYSGIQTVGSEDVNGRPAWKVEMTPKQGKVETFFFDRDSGLLVRMSQTAQTPMSEIPVEVDLSDYRNVEGIETPFALTQKAVGQTIAIRFEKVTYRAELPPGRFDLPPTVRDLLAKKKTAAQ